MRFLWDSAIGLLVVTGGLLGMTLPFGKLATAAGVPAMVWAFVISLGAGGVLLLALLLRGERIRLTPHKLRYFFVTAAISYAFPNLLMFSAIPHLGAGYTGIMSRCRRSSRWCSRSCSVSGAPICSVSSASPSASSARRWSH